MDAKRAQEIVAAEETIPVQYNGSLIWIDSVDPERQTARVHPQDNPGQVMEVPVDRLQEL